MKLKQRTLRATGPFLVGNRWLLRWRRCEGRLILYLLDLNTVIRWVPR